MKRNTIYNKIIDYLSKHGKTTPNDLILNLESSPRAIFKELNKLLEDQGLQKEGIPPKVYYSIAKKSKDQPSLNIPEVEKNFLKKNFLHITNLGKWQEGVDGFTIWCQQRNLDPEKTVGEYINTLNKYESYRKKDLINGMYKLKHSFSKVFLDEIFYLDFYSIERFGKTRLGQMLLYAKQSQNRKLIKKLSLEINPFIKKIIKEYNIDCVGFIPPSVKRQVQLMKELERNLNLSLPKLKISKVRTDIIVPQKTLSKIEDRVENASNTIVVEEKRIFNNILLIDDAVGSGATLNENRSKYQKKRNLQEKYYWTSNYR